MKSQKHGENTSEVEISNISNYGIWLFIQGKEYFLPYEEYPWFKAARLSDIFDVVLLHNFHLYWEKLDIDLEIDCLNSPEEYPLIYK